VPFVFGFIGADVARVAYEPPSGEPTDLELYAVGADFPEWQAYGGFVDQPVAGSYVVIYDTAGAELGRSVDLRWPRPCEDRGMQVMNDERRPGSKVGQR
jgi:hypothetical protein